MSGRMDTYTKMIRENSERKSTITFVDESTWKEFDWPELIDKSKKIAAWFLKNGFKNKKFLIVGNLDSLSLTLVVSLA